MKQTDQATGGICPLEWALDVIAGKWKGLILWHIGAVGALRHAALRRRLTGITQKVLTQQLRQLERDGLISRTIYPGASARVEYRLTTLGARVRPHLEALRIWGRDHLLMGTVPA